MTTIKVFKRFEICDLVVKQIYAFTKFFHQIAHFWDVIANLVEDKCNNKALDTRM